MKKFLSGEVGLATAYWLVTLPCYVILAGLAAAIHLKPKEPATIAWVAGLMLVMVITSIGLWKSASNYAGLALWKYLVKLGCILSIGVVGTVAFLAVTDSVKALKGSTAAAETFRYDVFFGGDGCKASSTSPTSRVELLPNDERREVYERISSFTSSNKSLTKLSNCTYMDSKNWSCGGDFDPTLGMTNNSQKMIAGEYFFEQAGKPTCALTWKRVQ